MNLIGCLRAYNAVQPILGCCDQVLALSDKKFLKIKSKCKNCYSTYLKATDKRTA